MFRPPAQAEPNVLADFLELMAWDQGSTSKTEMLTYLGQTDDNENNIGCDDNDDIHSDYLDDVLIEVERRVTACGRGYPFVLDSIGTILRHSSSDDDPRAIVYRSLLLSTRLNMKTQKIQGGIDGTFLLEELSGHVLRNYLGPTRSQVHIIGTSNTGGFSDKIGHLCNMINEGGGYKNRDSGPSHIRDGHLDAVAWIPFSDLSAGKIIIFAQCKTGSTWRDSVSELHADAFIKKWMVDSFPVLPVRAFCVAEAVDRSKWHNVATDAGIIFDRCRIVDFCDDLPADLVDRVNRWSSAAKRVALETPKSAGSKHNRHKQRN